MGVDVRLVEWGAGDLPLLTRLMGDPEMTVFLGGPESPEKLAERQAKYERIGGTGTGRMFKIVDAGSGEAVGSVGYWDKEWRGEQIYETGWSVLPEFQGRGFAKAGTAAAIERARDEGKHPSIHAFPSIENAVSNALCERLGFTLVEECEFEFPPGNILHCNEWRLDL